jgi:hypothetical protein
MRELWASWSWKTGLLSKGRGKEGQGPRQKKKSKEEKTESAVVAADEEKDELFAFVCTSAYANIAETSGPKITTWYLCG